MKVVPVGRSVRVMVFGGPSFFTVEQALVNEVESTDSYRYDVATFDRAVTNTAKKSKVGVNVGGDVAYFFTRQRGVGGGAQYSGTTVDLPSPDGGTVSVKAGGLQAGGGLRLRF